MRRFARLFAVLLSWSILPAAAGAGEAQRPSIEPLVRVVDLKVGQQASVKLANGKTVDVKLLDLKEQRDNVRDAVRKAFVTVEVGGRKVTLRAATYHLPVTVGDVQIDCSITKGHVQGENNPWSLDADARLRLWPAGSPWIRPGTFAYPVPQRWFASGTIMANEIGDGERPEDKSIYYHWGLDIGGAESLAPVLAATDGVVVSSGDNRPDPPDYPAIVKPRYDVVYLRDNRGWYYRYSHLDSIDPAVKVGARVKMGQKIGAIGKRGASGGWSHLHFDIAAMQPSGRYGILEGYAFFWQAYRDAHQPKLQAVARPHLVAWTGEPVTLEAGRSWSVKGPGHITDYQWILSDGTTAKGPTVEHGYKRRGTYRETLKITDAEGRVDYDFAKVYINDRKDPKLLAPRLHAAYWPTFGIKAGDEVTFKVRSFAIEPDDGHETWDFGDGSPTVRAQSDSNAVKHAKDGYAVTTHVYQQPGHYLVSVQRTNRRGETGTDRLHVRVAAADGVPVGVAKVDITPSYPIRLIGYSGRTAEISNVAQRLSAKALAIGPDGGDGPALLVMVDNCGVPRKLVEDLAARLKKTAGVKRERFVVCSTHTHTGPWTNGFMPLSHKLPADQRERIDRYTKQLAGWMEEVSLAALAARRPGRQLSWARGSVSFAGNRRKMKDGKWVGFGFTPDGAVDHDLPILRVTESDGRLVAVVVNYACHGTTLGGDNANNIHGDWPGCAQRCIEADHPGVMAFTVAGCGADSGPQPTGTIAICEKHGRTMADEVKRLLAGKLTPIDPKLTARLTRIKLPLEKLPNREEFEQRVTAGQAPKASGSVNRLGRHARTMLDVIKRDGQLAPALDYPVQTWVWGDDLAMVFLAGEVVVDYSLRLKRELDSSRLWVTAYSNETPCYLASRRILSEGGYEASSWLLPSRLGSDTEDMVIDAVRGLLPADFRRE